MSSVDQTLDEVSHARPEAGEGPPILFVVLEADRPHARGTRYSLVGIETVTVGRGEARGAFRSADGKRLDLRFAGGWVSSQHAFIRSVGGHWIAEDAGSRNGTYVNGARLEGSRVLHDGDVVEAGRTFLAVRGPPAVEGPLVRDEDAEQTTRPFALPSAAWCPSSSSARPGPERRFWPARSMRSRAARGRSLPSTAVRCPRRSSRACSSAKSKAPFSGAARDEPGFVRSADGGTLLLDEIGDLPATSQAALLRILQAHEVLPIGSTRPVKVDVRVVAATHRPLEGLAESGAFRIDLLARLKGYVHRIPPLRDRMADFGTMLADVLSRVAAERAPRLTLSPRPRAPCSLITGRSTYESSSRRWRARSRWRRVTSSSSRTCSRT